MPGQPYVVVAGGLNADIQGRSSGPFRPGDSNPGRVFCTPGGVGRNIAENLVRLGCKVELVSVLGDDYFSSWLAASCRSLGIGTELCLARPGAEASRYLCLLDADGSLAGAVAAMDGMDDLTPEVLAARTPAFLEADLIVADANLPVESLAWIAALPYRTGRRRPSTLLDTVSTAKAARARGCVGAYSMVKPNLAEAEALTGIPCSDEDGASRAAAGLRGMGAERVFLSMGHRGILYDGPDGRGVVRPPSFEAASLSGAGDAAAAALVWARLRGLGSRRAAELAVAAAALTAAAWETVSPLLDPKALGRAAEGVKHEAIR